MTKVYKIELLVIDMDDLGPAEVISVLENQKYPNYCISPTVKRITTKEVEWSDEHPLNNRDTSDAAYIELFD